MPSGERRDVYSSSRRRWVVQLLELCAGCLTTRTGLDGSPVKEAAEALKGRVGEEILSGRGDITTLLDEGMFSIIALKLQWLENTSLF